MRFDHTEAAEAGARALRQLVRYEYALDDFIDALPQRYLATVSPTEARAHFEIWKHAQGRHLAGAPVSRPDLGDMGEVVFIAEDRPGLLAQITGALAAHSIDILSAEIPLVLRRGNLYASAAISGTAIYFILVYLGVARGMATWAGMIVVTGVRVASIIWGLQLPVFVLESDGVSAADDRTSESRYS